MYVTCAFVIIIFGKQPFLALAFLLRFCQIYPLLGTRPSGHNFFGVRSNTICTENSHQLPPWSMEDQISVFTFLSARVSQGTVFPFHRLLLPEVGYMRVVSLEFHVNFFPSFAIQKL
jgi:hypothetical protein